MLNTGAAAALSTAGRLRVAVYATDLLRRTTLSRAVAEAGHVMPQKSTFFYPKVLTGLAIHTLEPGRRVALG